ncbi:MAG: hypothetical protein D6830_04585 [Ignavibacteria bacterium]|nr:MAG: hypothetical protein D6830_04585 [Ignavibacteria bacterium]
MNRRIKEYIKRPIFLAQTISMLLIWLLVIGIVLWISNLLYLASDLKDSFGASVGISIVAVPVFITLAGVLTYVFIGLHKEEMKIFEERNEI